MNKNRPLVEIVRVMVMMKIMIIYFAMSFLTLKFQIVKTKKKKKLRITIPMIMKWMMKHARLLPMRPIKFFYWAIGQLQSVSKML